MCRSMCRGLHQGAALLPGPLPTAAVEGALKCPEVKHKPPGEGRGMLKGLQETTRSQRQRCSPPLPL